MASKNNSKNRYPLPPEATAPPQPSADDEAHVVVQVASTPATAVSKATDLYCPVSRSTKHTWDTTRRREVGRSWHGVVTVVPCKDCDHEYCNH